MLGQEQKKSLSKYSYDVVFKNELLFTKIICDTPET